MSDFERKKFLNTPPKPKLSTYSGHTSSPGRGFFNKSTTSREFPIKEPQSTTSEQTKINQPKILLKVRDHATTTTEEPSTTTKRVQKEPESTTNAKESEVVPTIKNMTKSHKLIEDSVICTDHLQEFVKENSDFLVIGVVGCQGVGKSTLLNLLAHKHVTNDLKKSLFKRAKTEENDYFNIKILTEKLENISVDDNEIFKIQTVDDVESNCNTTHGVDIFITSNRTILLDCQPICSVSVLDDLIESENKRTNLFNEFIPLENSGEIQGLQLTAFLMSVCHVLFVVQDWFFDSNVVRFIHTAEMLKPTISNPEDEYMEHFPHLVLLHNRAVMEDFSPAKFKIMQQTYKALFSKTKLNLYSNLGLGFGRIINTLNAETCGNPINLFLVPDVAEKDEIYYGHPPLEDLIRRLRANLLAVTKNPLTHVQLTEKTWLIYCTKVWDTVKKSSFFVEYTKLMP